MSRGRCPSPPPPSGEAPEPHEKPGCGSGFDTTSSAPPEHGFSLSRVSASPKSCPARAPRPFPHQAKRTLIRREEHDLPSPHTHEGREAADSLKKRAGERLLRATSRGSHGVLMQSGRATTASSTTRPARPARTTTNKTRLGYRRRREMALPRSAGPREVPIRHFPPPRPSLARPPLRKVRVFS